jgi:hypothetical protein
MVRSTVVGWLVRGLLPVELLRWHLCLVGSFVGRAILALGLSVVTGMNITFLSSLLALHLLFSFHLTPFSCPGFFRRGSREVISSFVFFIASINLLIHLITSSSEVIQVFGSSGLPWASSWVTPDGDGIAILRNKLRVRTDFRKKKLSHRQRQTVRTQFSKDDVAVFYWLDVCV